MSGENTCILLRRSLVLSRTPPPLPLLLNKPKKFHYALVSKGLWRELERDDGAFSYIQERAWLRLETPVVPTV